ncbi:MAG TPA: hypothetical protein VM658_19575 [bacterium]|nr:hypothetical protein [bacterium]
MKKKNLLWIGMVAVMGLCISLAWIACQQVPNEDKSVSLSLDLNIPDAPAAPAPEVGPLAAAPGDPAYHVKITLTNPDETWYVYYYIPGVPVSLMVASGSGRVLNVEVYEVDNSYVYYEQVPAIHYITSEPVTLDLTGSSASVSVEVFQDFNTGYLYSGLPHRYVDPLYGNTTLPDSCPDPDYYYAWVNDAFFGLTFPTFQVNLFPEGPAPLYIDNLLRDRLYFIEIYNEYAGIYDDMAVFTGAGDSVGVPPLLFQGFNPDRSIVFSPTQIQGVNAGDSVQVNFHMRGGWGSISYTDYNYGYDSCGGYEIMPGVWKTYPIWRTVCVISIYAEDCDFMYAEGSMNVYTNLTPNCNHNLSCEPSLGEDNHNCPGDCYCMDGTCFPPWEDPVSCPDDCSIGPVAD